MKLKRLLLIFIVIFSLFLLIFYVFLNSSNFKYVYSSSEIIDIDDVENLLRNNFGSDYTLANGHKFVLYSYGPCFYENNSRGGDEFLENKEYLDVTTCNGATLANDSSFYVGYFKTLVEAIHFGEANYKQVNDYLYSNSAIAYNANYSYYIDVICDPKRFGYIVSFDSITAALQLNEDQNRDDTCHEKPTTKINVIHNFIEETPWLKHLNVFFVIDVILGDVQYMNFTIK